jgi:hypothetical protein
LLRLPDVYPGGSEVSIEYRRVASVDFGYVYDRRVKMPRGYEKALGALSLKLIAFQEYLDDFFYALPCLDLADPMRDLRGVGTRSAQKITIQ